MIRRRAHEFFIGNLRIYSKVEQMTREPLAELSSRLVRNGWSSELEELLRAALQEDEEDTFVLAFHTRDVRGGKGERDLFIDMVRVLLTERPMQMRALLPLIPEYGCWRDLVSLPTLSKEVIELMALQLEDDQKRLQAKELPSLCAKWAPREGKNTPMAKLLAARMFPKIANLSHRLKIYRKTVADLNRALDTTEIKMCGRTFATIHPCKVPALCFSKNIRAFLNETLGVYPHGSVYRPRFENDLRHPDDADRMKCRENFEAHLEAREAEEKKASLVRPLLESPLSDKERLLTQLHNERYMAVRLCLRSLHATN